MPSAISLLALLPYFTVLTDMPGSWPGILSAIGLQEKPAALSSVFVLGAGAGATPEWAARVENGAILILEGDSSLAEMFGFSRDREFVRVASVLDVHNSKLPIIWEKAVELPRYRVPPGARVFTRERWNGAPLVAGFRRGAGAVLWVAAQPGKQGYERFPYLLQALVDLGLPVPFRSSRLWAFFDSSYRKRVDLDYFAERWRRAGISALHVAAWHFFEPDAEGDQYLKRLVEACHRRGILVYAWLELPHVSEKFWNDHPEWREKTAVLQDAHLDWRKLMNLSNPECVRAVAQGVRDLVARADWDGVNLAELYFESLEGIGNPSRFTPMNNEVRAEFRRLRGLDPLELFRAGADAASRRVFLDFRADLVARTQEQWLREVEQLRRERPHLDVVLTHVDDRFDPTMRDAIGADAGRVLPLLERYAFTFLVEDPATVWHLGAQRYPEIARRYQPLTPHQERLAIDINIADRYQDVYPTRQQTGTELLQLVHAASAAFARVALYFEASILQPDLPLLPAAASAVRRFEKTGNRTVVDSPQGVGVPWRGPALVDGRPWPVADDYLVWIPAGAHTIEPGAGGSRPRIQWFTGELLTARYAAGGAIELSYRSSARAFAAMDVGNGRLEIDGVQVLPEMMAANMLRLPRGQHLVTIRTQ